MIRVLLVDDHLLVRAGLRQLLEQSADIEVEAVADSGEIALTLDAELSPDVVLMDVSMPGLSGIEATRRLCANRPGASVVILTASTDRAQVVAALDAGAVGYLVKDSEPGTLLDGVRSAANGESPLDPRAARAVLDARVVKQPALTDREREVLHLTATGLSNKALARQLGISEKTVKAHLTRIFVELGVSTRTQAALWAQEHLALGHQSVGGERAGS